MDIKCADDSRPINDRLNVFITIKIRNSWIKIDNNSAEKFFLSKKRVLFCCFKTKETCFF